MQTEKPISTLDLLGHIVAKYQDQPQVSLDTIRQELNDRSIGLLLLLLALPNCFPTLPGESTVLSIPIMLMGVQLMLGSHQLWLPHRLRDKSVSYQTLKKTIASAQPIFRRLEKLIKPRLGLFQHPVAHRVAGVAVLLQGMLLFLPIPFGNLVPGICIVLMALSLLEKDGVLFMLSLVVGVLGFVAMDAAIRVAWFGFENALAAIGTDIEHIGTTLMNFLQQD